MKINIPFSWKAIVVAPLVVPLIVSVFITLTAGGTLSLESFAGLAVILFVTCVMSYGATIFMFLPTLFIAALFMRVKAWSAGAVGAALGAVTYLPVSLFMYKASGPDSGPPTESYWEFMCKGFWVPALLFMGAGLITGLAYWFLARRSVGQAELGTNI